MGSFSNYLENKVLDHVTGKSSYTAPTVYVALSTADPTEDGSGVAEPSGNNYARVETSSATWNSASSGATSNANAITFPVALGSWGTITHFVLYDAASGGNMLAYGSLASSQSVSADERPKFASGELDITLD